MKNILYILFTPLLLLLLGIAVGLCISDSRLPRQDQVGTVSHDWHYIHSDAFGHFDHELYYYNIGHVMDAVRQANVIFLGTSRSLFAYETDTLDAFSTSSCLRFYLLAFPFRESMAFPLLLIEKYDIRGKVVVVEADDAFFTDGLGKYAESVSIRGTVSSVARIDYNTSKYRIILAADKYVRSALGKSIDNVFDFNKHVLYRSRATGAWFTKYYPENASNLVVNRAVTEQNRKRMLSPSVLAGAHLLVDNLRNRGCTVIFASVPYPEAPPTELVHQLASAVGADFIETQGDGLSVRDGEHLTLESARRFTETVIPSILSIANKHAVGAGGTAPAHPRK